MVFYRFYKKNRIIFLLILILDCVKRQGAAGCWEMLKRFVAIVTGLREIWISLILNSLRNGC